MLFRSPGEAIFLGAGNVHCYLDGFGVEVMANSDNVLRCGLTSKHVDVGEVLAITDFTPLTEPRCPVRDGDGAAVEFDVPVPDFSVTALDPDAYRGSCAVGGTGPYLVLCTDGAAEVAAAAALVSLRPGQAAYVRAREAAFTVSGRGRAFLTSIGTVLQT